MADWKAINIGEKKGVGTEQSPLIFNERNPHIHGHANNDGTYTITMHLPGTPRKLHHKISEDGTHIKVELERPKQS